MRTTFAITETGIAGFHNGKSYTVPTDHPKYDAIIAALGHAQFDKAVSMIDTRAAVSKWLSHGMKLVDGAIEVTGRKFSHAVTDKVLRMVNGGAPAVSLQYFLEKLQLNPSSVAQDELLLFCAANQFMIHEDGDILAYKSVRDDFTDIHSGTFSNKVGNVCSMARNTVDDRRDVTCSHGLHFASHEYASTWAGQDRLRLVLLKINPKNVVSIPSDYNNQKGRCCEYKVIAEIPNFAKLPLKEVYTVKDVKNISKLTKVADLQAELARKEAVRANWRSELDKLEDRNTQIKALGGIVPTKLRDESVVVINKMDHIDAEIDDLRLELADLGL